MSMDPYNARVRELFAAPQHAGSLANAVRVENSAQDTHIEIFARITGGTIELLRFHAWGCPHLIAATEAACAEYEGQTASRLEEFSATDLMQSLAVPAAKSGRILVLEDTLHLLGAALRESSSITEQN